MEVNLPILQLNPERELSKYHKRYKNKYNAKQGANDLSLRIGMDHSSLAPLKYYKNTRSNILLTSIQ